MLSKIKTALRITHNKLNDDITSTINSAVQEMIRLGVDEDIFGDQDDDLDDVPDIIYSCIKAYCQMMYTDDEKKKEMYYKSFETQVDGLRKSTGYGA